MGIIILGSGVAGIAAGYYLKQSGEDVTIYEKNSYSGGLCANFLIDGFRFDNFVHFFFSENEELKKTILNNAEYYEHKPEASNYYNGVWLRHPTQNNLYPLPVFNKIMVLLSFLFRKRKNIKDIKNYEEWLKCQYGTYFTEHFPMLYTKKYWGIDAKDLETKWVGKRMYSPGLVELVKGMFFKNDKNFYYAKNMRYPKIGGYWTFFEKFAQKLNIKLNKEVIKINPKTKTITFKDKSKACYDKLFSSLPLPDMVNLIEDTPQEIKQAGKNLAYTSAYIVSIGIKGNIKSANLWLYCYDKNIPLSRIYISSKKSPDNSPQNCAGLQAEIYFKHDKNLYEEVDLLKTTIQNLVEMGLIKEEDILIKDIRKINYANIIFNHEIYKCRKIVLDYLRTLDITPIGRFGKWEYFWSDQAFEDGRKEAEEFLCR